MIQSVNIPAFQAFCDGCGCIFAVDFDLIIVRNWTDRDLLVDHLCNHGLWHAHNGHHYCDECWDDDTYLPKKKLTPKDFI